MHRLLPRPCVLRCSKQLGRRYSNTTVLSQTDKKSALGLGWVSPDNRQAVQRILELADRAADSWDVTCSDFLTPAVLADAMTLLSRRSDLKVLPWGGYAQAERCRLLMGREEILVGELPDPSTVAAIQVTGNFLFDPARHPDFLGACLGTGVVRERVGDILVQGETGAQILVDPEQVQHFVETLTQVRTVPVVTRPIPLTELAVAAPRTQEINSVEASMRLDAIASAGFKVSRSKMADLVTGGDVRVNWKTATKASTEVKEGDVISCTGKGRLEIRSVNLTKKDKFALAMVRHV